LVALVLTVVGVALVFVMQQCGQEAPKPADQGVVAPGSGDMLSIQSSMMVRLDALMRGLAKGDAQAQQQVANNRAMMVGQLEPLGAGDPIAEFRLLMVRAELGEEIAPSLAPFEDEPERFVGAREDALTLRLIGESGPGAISVEQREALVNRHGYFARLALTRGLADEDPARAPFVGGGGWLLFVMIALGVLALGAVVAVGLCAILGVVWAAQGKIRPRFVAPTPGGSVFLEMTACMVWGFLLLSILRDVALKDAPLGVSLGLQWLLVGVVFYPLLRGMKWDEWRRRLGFTRGKGVFREVLAGLFAYFAMLPVVVAVLVVTLIGMLVWQWIKSQRGAPPEPLPENPILEIAASGSWGAMLMLFTLATIWAPLVEETVFRGALYRHLRGRVGVFLGAAISAVAFGVMHGYEWFLLGGVISLGFVFALMREWRGSLIAPIVAHALHNATLLAMVMTLLSAIAPPR
jgi:membrane protease YdiL (CAAX protease family)